MHKPSVAVGVAIGAAALCALAWVWRWTREEMLSFDVYGKGYWR